VPASRWYEVAFGRLAHGRGRRRELEVLADLVDTAVI
jgi:hypothetical protein